MSKFTEKSFKFRLFTPMISAPADTAEAISFSSWASTRADRPKSWQMVRYRSRVFVSSRAQMRSTQSAPMSLA